MSKTLWIIVSVIFDAILVNIGIILAFLIRFGGDLPFFNFQAYTNLAISITLLQLGALYVYDLYDPEKIQGGWSVFYAVFKAVTLGFLLIVGVTFFYRFFSFPRTVLFLAWILNIVLIAGWRSFATEALKIKWPTKRVLIVGISKTGQEILKELKQRGRWGYEVTGLVEKTPEKVGESFMGVPILGTIKDIISLVREHKIDQIIVTKAVGHRELVKNLTDSIKAYVKVDVIPDHYEIITGRVDYTLISDIPLVELTREPPPSWFFSVKRLADLVLASVLSIITLPVTLIASILIKLNSKGPVLYKQKRVGLNEKQFNVYKFRTMITGAEKKTGPVLAKKDDPRITFVGRFLRNTRIDELPQLINILKGDMSFIGPRPERPVFVEDFKKKIPRYNERFKARPGITGLAQVSGFYATTARNKLKYDLIYIYHQSLYLDLKIIFQTIKVILTGRGAR